ncbi:DNA helicase RecQ [Wenzhouxiangella marina]|uniref:DNA helicase RecQ n=1 Tax=Wenzhouxiangella marina TaxID=1579979 RepID=A0A0K0XSP4_9GAMM|nr:DNA helicase RecQ [Wenzhouxiangella marina]AKS40685.1 ATP-dependent DNA helicase RecQ [Wenzhouxiangella marina]MBB6088455.1 ATP-dependent DNA helicase RecQ [Wenzhouxiangella marina]
MSSTTPERDPQRILERVFGYQAFRGQQRAIVDSIIDGRHALVLMPTGGGKSLCYQIPALARRGTAVVVSPLIALMRDQVEALTHNGVAAAVLNSSLDAATRQQTERDLVEGRLDLIYIAPERLLREPMLRLLEQTELSLIAIDEAHCVSQWGHDFRPEYLKLGVLGERFPDVPRLALTATADERTRAEIRRCLLPAEAETFIDSFDRPNIRYRVGLKHRAREQLLSFIQNEHAGESGIVYCFSRRKTEQTAAWLSGNGVRALPYHAGLGDEERRQHQDRFIREDGLVICATIAFGMGIDKPDVRFVAHLDLPKSMEAYYQETGRAGRDGLPADAWMVYSLADIVQIRQLLDQSGAGEAQKRLERERLEALLAYCEHAGCRRPALLAYFDETHPGHCGNCDNCQTPPTTWDATEAARKLLSCVYRTGQRFGAGHLVDVLLGKDSDRMRQFGHDQLSVHGIGTEHDKATWHSVVRQLLALGYLRPDPEGHGGLVLDDSCRELLRGEQKLTLREDIRPAGRKRAVKARADVDTGSPLWQALRQWRTATAGEEGVPPYVIFHDATLAAIVEAEPESLDELAGISGVGRHKLDRYGEQVLEVLASIQT